MSRRYVLKNFKTNHVLGTVKLDDDLINPEYEAIVQKFVDEGYDFDKSYDLAGKAIEEGLTAYPLHQDSEELKEGDMFKLERFLAIKIFSQEDKAKEEEKFNRLKEKLNKRS